MAARGPCSAWASAHVAGWLPAGAATATKAAATATTTPPQPSPAPPSGDPSSGLEGLFDSHCHLPHDGCAEGIAGLKLVCGIHEANWVDIGRLSDAHPALPVGYGLHPWWAGERTGGWEAELRRRVKAAQEQGRPVVVGEIGLDKLKGPPMAEQQQLCVDQLRIASELGCAVSVHCVRAFGELEGILSGKKRAPLPANAVMHSWLGSADATRSLMRRAACRVYFGIGPLCIRSETKLAQVLSHIPQDRLLVESDSHDPASSWDDVHRVVTAISKCLTIPEPRIAELTAANARAAYGLCG